MVRSRILALTLLFATSVMIAQESVKTNLVLTVTDQTGAVIPNATTHVESNDHAISFGTKTDNTGQVTFELMQGNYTIKVSSQGFRTSTSQVQVNTESTQSMRIVLKVGGGSHVEVFTDPSRQINIDEISMTTFIPLIELTPFPLRDQKLQRHQFKLLPCLVSISCVT